VAFVNHEFQLQKTGTLAVDFAARRRDSESPLRVNQLIDCDRAMHHRARQRRELCLPLLRKHGGLLFTQAQARQVLLHVLGSQVIFQSQREEVQHAAHRVGEGLWVHPVSRRKFSQLCLGSVWLLQMQQHDAGEGCQELVSKLVEILDVGVNYGYKLDTNTLLTKDFERKGIRGLRGRVDRTEAEFTLLAGGVTGESKAAHVSKNHLILNDLRIISYKYCSIARFACLLLANDDFESL
jgi:hypothetical protein